MNIKFITFLSIVVFFNLSCIVKKATINSYVDPTYSIGIIQKIAIFPIICTQIESYEAENVNRKILEGIQYKNPFIEIINPNTAKNLINHYQLDDDWNTFREKYIKYGRPDFKILALIKSKLKIDAIMQGEIIDVKQQDGHLQINTAKTVVTLKYSIIGLNRGKLIWEASSNGLTENEVTSEKAPPIMDSLDLAVDIIIDWLPVL
jgi:hypothetical protein